MNRRHPRLPLGALVRVPRIDWSPFTKADFPNLERSHLPRERISTSSGATNREHLLPPEMDGGPVIGLSELRQWPVHSGGLINHL